MNLKDKKILITGGGTGGHVMPALAIVQFLKSKGLHQFLYVGGYKGMENNILPDEQLSYTTIWISGFLRGKILVNLLFPVKLLVSFWQAVFILFKFRPDLVVGTGGYVTGPMVFMASVLGFATMIVEQDIYPGVTTRLLARHVDKICLAFEKSTQELSYIATHKMVVTGNPVRPDIQKKDPADARKNLGLKTDGKTLLIFGGSQGARFVNQAILKILDELKKMDIQIIWQTGQGDAEEVSGKLRSSGISGKVSAFISHMAEAYSAADVVVARAGAISIAEIGMMQLPAVLIPYPHAAGDHQKKNAELIREAGAGIVITQDTVGFEQVLLDNIRTLFRDEETRKKMSDNWQKIYKGNALSLIFEQMQLLMKR